MIEPLCAALLVALMLCGSASGANGAALTILRYSPSTDLLGRQVAVAPAVGRGQPWGDPRRLAFCGPDGIQRTVDGGQTWTRVPTDAVADLAAATDMPLATHLDGQPVCRSVVLDPHVPDAFYAVFAAVKAPQDAPPPWFAAGYVTRDAGQSWEPVPVPTGGHSSQFRGFVADEAGVQALFAPVTPSRAGSTGPTVPISPDIELSPPDVLATTNAGQTWEPVPFACPATGPCIRWGAPPTAIGSCNMHGYGQPLLFSEDDGRTWRSPTGAGGVNACRPNELVIVSDREVLLLAPGTEELAPGMSPILTSHDGGRTFAAPLLPDEPAARDLFELHLLPDERLVARVSGASPEPGWSWRLLWHDAAPPSQDRWCAVADPAPLPTNGAPLRVAGERIWWIDDDAQPASLAVADLRCADDGPN